MEGSLTVLKLLFRFLTWRVLFYFSNRMSPCEIRKFSSRFKKIWIHIIFFFSRDRWHFTKYIVIIFYFPFWKWLARDFWILSRFRFYSIFCSLCLLRFLFLFGARNTKNKNKNLSLASFSGSIRKSQWNSRLTKGNIKKRFGYFVFYIFMRFVHF